MIRLAILGLFLAFAAVIFAVLGAVGLQRIGYRQYPEAVADFGMAAVMLILGSLIVQEALP